MNLVAADVSPLHLKADAVRADSRRRLRFRGSKRESFRGILSPSDAERENTKLTAAINRAKDSGDIAALREIAEDPHSYVLRQGWASLDFSDEAELNRLRRLYETLQLEIITVIEFHFG